MTKPSAWFFYDADPHCSGGQKWPRKTVLDFATI